MTIGDGIFGAALVFALVAALLSFKGNSNWKKPILGSLVFFVFVGLSLWGWMVYSDRPRAQSTLWNIALGESTNDVRFKMGMPQELRVGISDSDLTYVYQVDDWTDVWIRFWDERVQGVTVLSGENSIDGIQGIAFGSSTEMLIERFGRPSKIQQSKNGLSRIYSFPKYQLFFALIHDRVDAMGMYRPALGLPIAFME